jgi:hypothetical protein
MVAALAPIWEFGATGLRVPVAEAITWVDTALGASEGESLSVRGPLLWARCSLAYHTFDFVTLSAKGEQGLRLARHAGDDRLAGRSLVGLALARGHSNESAPLWLEAIATSRRAGDSFILPFALSFFALVHLLRDRRASRIVLDEALRLAADAHHLAASGQVRVVLGWSALIEGRVRDAMGIFEQGRRDGTQAGYALAVVTTEAFRALAHVAAGLFDDASHLAQRVDELSQRTGIRRDVFELQTKALLAAATGRLDAAVGFASAGLGAAAAPVYRSGALRVAVQVELAAGQTAMAQQHVREMMVLAERQGFAVTAAEAHVFDGRLQRRRGERAAAADSGYGALQAALDLPAWMTVVDSLELLAGLAGDEGGYEEASRLFGAAEAVRRSTGYELCLSERDNDVVRARDALGAAAFNLGYEEGLARPLDAVVADFRRRRDEGRTQLRSSG